jgi:hypothetical protein
MPTHCDIVDPKASQDGFYSFKIIRRLHFPLDITGCDSERRAKSGATICHNVEAGTAMAGWRYTRAGE